MTINTWRNEFLAVCRNCARFNDKGGNRYRYRCKKYKASIYKAYGCGRLSALMAQAAQISKQALGGAFLALTKPV
jgi:hypothetical protein